jgi:formylglycine-generating enzyme required for sulfatase activity
MSRLSFAVVIAWLAGAGLSPAAAPQPSLVFGTVERIKRGSDADRIAAAESPLMAKQGWRSSQLARKRTSLSPRDPKAGQREEQLGAAALVLDLGGGVTLELIRIPAGKFQMGSPRSEPLRHDDEGPVHTVRFARPFYMGKCEVTQAQWQVVMGTTVRQQRDKANKEGTLWGEGDDQPMYYVSWQEACEFCRRVARKTGVPIRLPTEAEWEYACRAGTITSYPWGASMGTSGTVANVADRRAKRDHPNWITADFDDGYATTAPVGKYRANAFGLHDMIGNVWEWCEDLWHENYENAPADGSAWVTGGEQGKRVLRGGSCFFKPGYCRSAFRHWNNSGYRRSDYGFRVAAGS